MDILKILKEDRDSLCLEDLDFFETELDTGGPYSHEEKIACMNEINVLRKWLQSEDTASPNTKNKGGKGQKEAHKSIIKDISELVDNPGNQASLSEEELIIKDIELIRKKNNYNTLFRKYLQKHSEVDSIFVSKHYDFFKSWELDAILSNILIDEECLEKYYDSLDKDRIAKYQVFSEDFFINHYNDLDVNLVLNNKKNAWHKKENRSRKLDLFLRLKGVQK